MSATAFDGAGKTDGAVGRHASVAVNRTAALFCYAALLGPGIHTETSTTGPDLNRLAGFEPARLARLLSGNAAFSLGAAKRAHFGLLSARKE
jgi:hypothetical protein